MDLAEFVQTATGTAAQAAAPALGGGLADATDPFGGLLGNIGQVRQALDEVWGILQHPLLQTFGITLTPQQAQQAPALGPGAPRVPEHAPPPPQAPSAPPVGIPGLPPAASLLLQHQDEIVGMVMRCINDLPEDPDAIMALTLEDVTRILVRNAGDGPAGELLRQAADQFGIDLAHVIEHDPDHDPEVPP